MAKFKEGDIVWLNSVSPPMTIELVNDNGSYNVVWMSEQWEVQRSWFKETCLTDVGPIIEEDEDEACGEPGCPRCNPEAFEDFDEERN